MEEFIINKFIKLKLEDNKTIIYVNSERFNQCKFLLLDIPIEETTSLEDIESIDDVAERLDRSLERENESQYTIPPKVEFWGHCSNLQVWYENDYNTKLIHRSLAFTLLKRLTEVGDKLAGKIFKEEVAERFEEGNETVKEYLRKEGFLEYLDNEQFCNLLYGVKFESFDDLLRVIGTYSIIDRMLPLEFLEFIDSLDNRKLKNLAINPKESNFMNFIHCLLDNIEYYRNDRSGSYIIENIFKKIGMKSFDYIMKLVINNNGNISLTILEALIWIDPEKIKHFLNSIKQKIRIEDDIDLWDFQYILNVLLRCFDPEELMIYLEKNHKDNLFKILLPKMHVFKSLKMSGKKDLDMKQFIVAFLLEEAGGDDYVENLRKLGVFLADIFLSELIDRNGELVEDIIRNLDWIGGGAAGMLYKKLNELSDHHNIEKYRHLFYY